MIPEQMKYGTEGLINEDECKSPEYRQNEERTFLEISGNIHNLAKEVQGSPNDPFRKLAEASERLIKKIKEIK